MPEGGKLYHSKQRVGYLLENGCRRDASRVFANTHPHLCFHALAGICGRLRTTSTLTGGRYCCSPTTAAPLWKRHAGTAGTRLPETKNCMCFARHAAALERESRPTQQRIFLLQHDSHTRRKIDGSAQRTTVPFSPESVETPSYTHTYTSGGECLPAPPPLRQTDRRHEDVTVHVLWMYGIEKGGFVSLTLTLPTPQCTQTELNILAKATALSPVG